MGKPIKKRRTGTMKQKKKVYKQVEDIPQRRKKGQKATLSEKEVRLSIIEEMVLKGYTSRELVAYARQNWGIERAQTINYMKEVHDEWKAERKAESHILRAKSINRKIKLLKQIEERLRSRIETSKEGKKLDTVELGAYNTIRGYLDSIDKVEGLIIDRMQPVLPGPGELSADETEELFQKSIKKKIKGQK